MCGRPNRPARWLSAEYSLSANGSEGTPAMISDPLDRRKYQKGSAFAAEDDLETDTVQVERGGDHAEWFLVGLIIFGLVAEIAIVLSTLSTPTR